MLSLLASTKVVLDKFFYWIFVLWNPSKLYLVVHLLAAMWICGVGVPCLYLFNLLLECTKLLIGDGYLIYHHLMTRVALLCLVLNCVQQCYIFSEIIRILRIQENFVSCYDSFLSVHFFLQVIQWVQIKKVNESNQVEYDEKFNVWLFEFDSKQKNFKIFGSSAVWIKARV